MLESQICGYRLAPYHPNFTLLPLLLKWVSYKFEKADLLHTSPDYGIFFKQKQIKMVCTFHNYVLDAWMRPYSSLLQKVHYAADLRLWTRMAVSKASRVTAVSLFTADLVKRDLPLDKPITVIYNGVDEKCFRPSEKRRLPDRTINVFFAGNLSLRKGTDWLPQIAEKLNPKSEIHFTQGLRKKGTIKPAKNMVPVGAVLFEEMPERYGKMDILLAPSVREGFGLAVAEAMSCGLPVVASDCSSIPELIDHGKGGFLCPVGAVDAFAEKINILADSPNLRREMGEYNRAKVEKMFTLDRMVKEYKALFEEVMDDRGGR